MFGWRGKPKNWLATAFAAVGFPLLLAALVLAAATPSRIYPLSAADEAGELAAQDGTSEVAAVGTSSEAIDLAGWELYLHSAEAGRSHIGLISTAGIPPAAARVLERAYPTRTAASLPVRAQYRSQAPPV